MQMSGLNGRNVQSMERPIPGCLGRMVNLFDLGAAVKGNKLLTDTPHHDASSLSRSRSDIAQMPSPSYEDHTEAELVMSYFGTSASSEVTGTPMKKLIAQEMSKEVDHKQSSTNVVAKLMGLDTLPQLQLDTASQRSKSSSYSRSSPSSSGSPVDHGAQSCQEHSREFKDVYEMWHLPQKLTRSTDSSPRKGRNDEAMTEKHIALVRKKFMEAKRLVTDENLHQSKEFKDALEVLSSNKDLFVKFLQESNSLFSQHLSDFQPVPPHLETKRITVLRPSKAVDTEKFVMQYRRNKQIKKSALSVHGTGWDNRYPSYASPLVNRPAKEHPVQPTRIVVLKPSPGKGLDIKAVASSSPSSPRVLHGECYFDEPGDAESREVAKEITRQMRENLMDHRRNETLFSSALSNGYIGDDSSFNKSDGEYPAGNLSDSEIMSPVSRHSWDCPDRVDSPFSSSSFSRASISPESSVCREAKKRLSERWAMMTRNGSTQQKYIPRTSSTLGEMLALSDSKAPNGSAEEKNEVTPEAIASTSFMGTVLSQEGNVSDSLKTFAMSKSTPGVSLNTEVSGLGTSKAQVSMELMESRGLRSSWKISHLFFLRNKKASDQRHGLSQSSNEPQLASLEIPSIMTFPEKTSDNCSSLKDRLPPDTLRQRSVFHSKEQLTTAKLPVAGNDSENQDQPSPISVLHPPFDEKGGGIPECLEPSIDSIPRTRGLEMSLKSNLIDKSPPIGSIARTLSWDDDSSSDITRPATVIQEDEDWYIFIETLLTAAGLSGSISSEAFLVRWHSPESPLDPSLRDKYSNPNNKELIHEARGRQQRSNRKLIFDRVNAIIAERTTTLARTSLVGSAQPLDLVDHAWSQLKDWLSSTRTSSLDTGAAERAVRDEVVGKAWVDGLRIEMDDLGTEIEGKLLQELVEEAVADLTR